MFPHRRQCSANTREQYTVSSMRERHTSLSASQSTAHEAQVARIERRGSRWRDNPVSSVMRGRQGYSIRPNVARPRLAASTSAPRASMSCHAPRPLVSMASQQASGRPRPWEEAYRRCAPAPGGIGETGRNRTGFSMRWTPGRGATARSLPRLECDGRWDAGRRLVDQQLVARHVISASAALDLITVGIHPRRHSKLGW